MRGEFSLIIGKRISGVIVRENDHPPKGQVFLMFDDGTYYELYSGPTDSISGLQHIGVGDIDYVRNLNHTDGNVVCDCMLPGDRNL